MTKFSIRSLLIVTLLIAVGIALYQFYNRPLFISEVPRPNSGRYTAADAGGLDEFLSQAVGISMDHQQVQDWRNRGIGFHVHVNKLGQVTVFDLFKQETDGMAAIGIAFEIHHSIMRGEPGAVLLTSDTDGWESPEEIAVLESVFEDPAVEIFVVTD